MAMLAIAQLRGDAVGVRPLFKISICIQFCYIVLCVTEVSVIVNTCGLKVKRLTNITNLCWW